MTIPTVSNGSTPSTLALSWDGCLDGGSFTLTSQSVRGKSYRIEGACPCKDTEHAPRCTHVLATWLWRTAQEALATPDDEGWCPIHGCQRHQRTNAKGSWWSHTLGTGT